MAGLLRAQKTEFSILPRPANFVNRYFAQKMRVPAPKICALLPIDFYKKLYYNYYIR
jgi:hypothetical protein